MSELKFQNISKRFGKKQALNSVSGAFSEGITALLGSNGAGKTTLMNIITTLLTPDNGNVTYNGTDVLTLQKDYYSILSVQFQTQPMYKSYTADEYLEFCGALKGLDKKTVREQSTVLLQKFGIIDARKKKIRAFSGGMKQRLALCGTFLGDPKIIILDEPSAGLDIYEREELKNHLCTLKKECIIIISTHIVSDIENIADRIILLKEGVVEAEGEQSELIEKLIGKVWQVPEEAELPSGVASYHSDGRRIVICDESPCDGAVMKPADLTDVYFNSIAKR